MRARQSRAFTVALAALAAVTLASASFASTMTIWVHDAEAPVDGMVDVQIDVMDAENVGAVQFELTYDPAVLEAMSARAGALASDALIEARTDRPGRMFVALITTSGVSGRGGLVTATFRVKGTAGTSTAVKPEAAMAWEGLTHHEILVTATSGQVSVAGGGLPWWIWLLVALAITVIIALARRRRGSPAREPAPPAAAGAFCRHCGKPIPVDSRFCAACGQAIS